MSSTFSGDHLSFSGFLDNILVDFPPQNLNFFSTSSDNSTPKTTSSGSDDGETNQWEEVMNPVDERRKKRKISNRESAKRSRMKKQQHLENLRNQVSRYESGNQELMNHLRFVRHNGQFICRENQRLRSELVMLQQRFYHLHQLMLVAPAEIHHPLLPSAWPCNNNVTAITELNLQSLITF